MEIAFFYHRIMFRKDKQPKELLSSPKKQEQIKILLYSFIECSYRNKKIIKE